MLIIIAPTDLLPLRYQPTQVSLAVDQGLLKLLEPSLVW